MQSLENGGTIEQSMEDGDISAEEDSTVHFDYNQGSSDEEERRLYDSEMFDTQDVGRSFRFEFVVCKFVDLNCRS